MSTITKEHVRERLTYLEGLNARGVGTKVSSQQFEIACLRKLLASLEAEAVAVTDDMAFAFHHALSDSSLGADEVEEIKAGLRAAFANVTAPPAPVSVPDALPENDDEEGNDIDYMEPSEIYALGRTAGWNACRAAMLHGAEPVKNHDELREKVRREHAEWSQATFGDVGPVGPLKHLSKEALEAAAEPGDLSEWADMQFLLWDAQRRAGISDGEITAAMEEKLKVNMARQWPEPKDGEPRLHIKAAPQQEVK